MAQIGYHNLAHEETDMRSTLSRRTEISKKPTWLFDILVATSLLPVTLPRVLPMLAQDGHGHGQNQGHGLAFWSDVLFVLAFTSASTVSIQYSLMWNLTYYARPNGVKRGVSVVRLKDCVETYGSLLQVWLPLALAYSLLGGSLVVVVMLNPPHVQIFENTLIVWIIISLSSLLVVVLLLLAGWLEIPVFARDRLARVNRYLSVGVVLITLVGACIYGSCAKLTFCLLMTCILLPVCVSVLLPTTVWLMELVRLIFKVRGMDYFEYTWLGFLQRTLSAQSLCVTLAVPFICTDQIPAMFQGASCTKMKTKEEASLIDKYLLVYVSGIKPFLKPLIKLGPRLRAVTHPHEFLEMLLNLDFYNTLATFNFEELNRRALSARQEVLPLNLHSPKIMRSLLVLFFSLVILSVLTWASALPLESTVLDLLGFSREGFGASFMEVPIYFFMLGNVLWNAKSDLRELADIASLAFQQNYDVQWEIGLIELIFENPSDVDEAHRRLDEMLQEHPDNHRAAFFKGMLLSSMDNYVAAEPLLRQAVSARPSFTGAWCELMHYDLYYRGDVEAAIVDIRTALEYDPYSVTCLKNLSMALSQLPEPPHEEIISHLRRALGKLDPHDLRAAEIHNMIAMSATDLGQDTVADAAYSSALVVQPRNATIRLEFAKLLQSRGEKGRCVEEVKAVFADDDWDKTLVVALNSAGVGAICCPAGHAMVQSVTPSDRYCCDGCGSQVPAGVEIWGCRACDFDFCSLCCKALQRDGMRARARCRVLNQCAQLFLSEDCVDEAADAEARFRQEAMLYTKIHPPDSNSASENDRQIAMSLARKLESKASAELLDKILKTNRQFNGGGALQLRAAKALDLGETGLAIDLFREAASVPQAPAAEAANWLLVAGQLLHRDGDVKAARPLLEKALSKFEELPEAERRAASERGDVNPDFQCVALDTVGKCCMMMGDAADGIKFLNQVACLKKNDAAAWGILGQAQAEQGLPECDSTLEKACKLYGSSEVPLTSWCITLGNWLQARPDRLSEFRKDPTAFGGGGGRDPAESCFVLAVAARIAKLSQADELGEEMLVAAKAASTGEILRLTLADLCGSFGDDVEDWEKRLLEATPGAEAEYRFASKLLGNDETEAALARLKSAVQKYPTANNISLMHAQILLSLKRSEEARMAAETSLMSGCSELELHVVIAKAFFQQARLNDAEVALRKLENAAQMAGDSEHVVQARQYLQMVANAKGNS